jgi:hypothetical protein
MASNTPIPSATDPSPPGKPPWPTMLAAAGAVAAGAVAVYSPSWAVGIATASGLFAALQPLLRRR